MVICNAYYLEKRKGVKIEMKIAVCGKVDVEKVQ